MKAVKKEIEAAKEVRKNKEWKFNSPCKILLRLTFIANLDFIPTIEYTNSEQLVTFKAKFLFVLLSFQRAK